MNPYRGEERVSGYVIGCFTKHLVLVAPNGNKQTSEDVPENTNEKQWGETKKQELLGVKCGNGKPLCCYPDIVKSIYGTGQWIVRTYDQEVLI